MAEQQVNFFSDALQLEGLLHKAPGEQGVVITHPHSLYGGSMHSDVVEAVVRAYQQLGYATLRFNFRGVGRSQGGFDQGRGERRDVISALDFMAGEGKKDVDLVGYSFGAWVNGLAAPTENKARHMVMVSPPVAFLDFGGVSALPQLRLVIAGDRDQFGPSGSIRSALSDWSPHAQLEIIHGADHFFSGCADRIEYTIKAHLQERQRALPAREE